MEDITKLDDIVRIVYHPIYMTDYSTSGCESPGRVNSIISSLQDRFKIVVPEPCQDEDILRCHTENVLAAEKFVKERFPVAKMAAGGAIKSAELAMEGFVAFGVIRPPGHHANPDHNWGFCFFNNMGIAIKKLLNDKKIRSATILDIDLHFGDGTEAIFKSYKDVQVLNIQSSNPSDFIVEARDSLKKINRSDIIGISAGFDQYELDWGANLSTDDYRIIGELSGYFAREKTGGRIFGILEGGYYLPDLGKNLIALLTGICNTIKA